MAFFIGLVLFALMVGAIVFACYQGSEDNVVACAIGWVLVVALLVTFILVPFSMHSVDAGEVAVVKYYGTPKEVKGSGLHYDLWVGKSYEYINTKEQEIPLTLMTYSSDAQVMSIEMSVHCKVLGDKAVDIVNEYGNEASLIARITSIMTEAPKAVLSSRTAMDVIANRGAVTPDIESAIINSIGEQYPITITKVAITNIDFSDAFEQAVEDKMIAEQNKLKAEYENEKKVASAEAEAKAKILEAEAEAKANELLEKSLTEQILRDKYLDKWDGKLPTTMVGEETGIMVTP